MKLPKGTSLPAGRCLIKIKNRGVFEYWWHDSGEFIRPSEVIPAGTPLYRVVRAGNSVEPRECYPLKSDIGTPSEPPPEGCLGKMVMGGEGIEQHVLNGHHLFVVIENNTVTQVSCSDGVVSGSIAGDGREAEALFADAIANLHEGIAGFGTICQACNPPLIFNE